MLCSKGDGHLASRKVGAEKAYYSLQGAGLKFNGLNPETSVSIYRQQYKVLHHLDAAQFIYHKLN